MPFRPVKDPVTGKIDMVEITPQMLLQEQEANSLRTGYSSGIEALLGAEVYQAVHIDRIAEDPTLTAGATFADGVCGFIAGMFGDLVPDENITDLARTLLEGHRAAMDGKLPFAMASTEFRIKGDQEDSVIAVTITPEEAIVTFGCEHGRLINPAYHLILSGRRLITAQHDEIEAGDEINMDHVRTMREATTTALRELRDQATMPANVVSLSCARAVRQVAQTR